MTSLTPDIDLIKRLLETISNDILPLTMVGVSEGNKIFGAALLDRNDYSLVLAETNNETDNPLWHGEMHVLKKFYEIAADKRPSTSELIFLSTHEPCTLCMSAITWAGFDNFFYLFSHEDSRDSFAIPHDLQILKEVFGLAPGEYRANNAFWDSFDIIKLINALPAEDRAEAGKHVDAITHRYADLSSTYQKGKSGNDIPLA